MSQKYLFEFKNQSTVYIVLICFVLSILLPWSYFLNKQRDNWDLVKATIIKEEGTAGSGQFTRCIHTLRFVYRNQSYEEAISKRSSCPIAIGEGDIVDLLINPHNPSEKYVDTAWTTSIKPLEWVFGMVFKTERLATDSAQ